MNKLKSNKGITLLSLIIYIIVIFIVMGILTSIRSFFNKNIENLYTLSKYACEFDKFNSSFVKSVKNNKHVIVDNNTITFEDGTTYIYNASDKGIYRNRIKICNNVTNFSITKKQIMINSLNKEILYVKIAIGKDETNIFNKSINYTLRYW